jgi:carbon storage regulator
MGFTAMLIVSRRKGQRIVIGHDIEVVVTETSRTGVKLGILAPVTLSILRGEVRDAVEEANRAALLSEIQDRAILPAQPLEIRPANPAVTDAAPEAQSELDP